jgi:biuret amidohydrolase
MKHAFGLSIPQTVEDAVDLESTALIVYDMQVGIIRQLKDGAEMVATVASVLEVAREGACARSSCVTPRCRRT